MTLAKILERNVQTIPGKLKVAELLFEVPKDYSKPDVGTLRVFARSVEKVEKPVDPDEEKSKQLPWLLWLQGGPGVGSPRPQHASFIHTIIDKGYKVLLLDQRGTGLSTTITKWSLAAQGGPKEQAEYLQHFRADSIVKDCEAIRKTLTNDYPESKKKWTVLGQSFGGFCCINYLSKFPEGLREVFLTGGLAPLNASPNVVYSSLFTEERVAERNRIYYEKYPEDVKRIHDLARHFEENRVELPAGGYIDTIRLRQLGLSLGGHGGVDTIHDIVFRMTNDLKTFGFLTRPSLSEFENMFFFDVSILYAILHEAIYCQGEASEWAAERVMATIPEFQMRGSKPIFFTAEMIFQSMFQGPYPELSGLGEVASLIAQKKDWPTLYDIAQLNRNEVPVYAATYLDDIYVDYDLAQETARNIKGIKQFITNSMDHGAIRSRTEDVLKELWKLRDDTMD